MQKKTERRSNHDRTHQMRARLVTAARHLFIEHGYGGTSTPAIVAAAGVTRGAMYHHFADKKAIFAAVIKAESAAVAAAIEEADEAGPEALSAVLAGSRAYLHAMAAPGRTRLLLIDGPSVLGKRALADIEARHSEQSLRDGLFQAHLEGRLRHHDVAALTALLSAMFERAALAVGEGAPLEPWVSACEAVINGLIETG